MLNEIIIVLVLAQLVLVKWNILTLISKSRKFESGKASLIFTMRQFLTF